ncbi:MAG: hypothetical protein OXM87_05280 [Truepera sp.]|nr:hypothetical protein [Truepera sp.]
MEVAAAPTDTAVAAEGLAYRTRTRRVARLAGQGGGNEPLEALF